VKITNWKNCIARTKNNLGVNYQ